MTKYIYTLALLSIILGSCQKETALNGLLETPEATQTQFIGDRDACETGSCNVQIRVRGLAPELSSGVVRVKRYDAGVLVYEKTLEFKPPLCTSCWIDVPVNENSKLVLVGNVFTGLELNGEGSVNIALRREGSAVVQNFALPGGGNTSTILQNPSCTGNSELPLIVVYQPDLQ
jgi:hypothetical protein